MHLGLLSSRRSGSLHNRGFTSLNASWCFFTLKSGEVGLLTRVSFRDITPPLDDDTVAVFGCISSGSAHGRERTFNEAGEI